MDIPELVGYLPSTAGPPRELLSDKFLDELASGDPAKETIEYQLEHGGETHEAILAELTNVLNDEPYLRLPKVNVPNESAINDFELFKEFPGSSAWDGQVPLVHVYFHHHLVEHITEFVETLAVELPIEFLVLSPSGPYEPDLFPGRGNYAEKVMRGNDLLNILGPSVTAEFHRETLLSTPAYEVQELDDGSVLLRAFEDFDDWHVQSTVEIREHLGLE